MGKVRNQVDVRTEEWVKRQSDLHCCIVVQKGMSIRIARLLQYHEFCLSEVVRGGREGGIVLWSLGLCARVCGVVRWCGGFVSPSGDFGCLDA